MASAIERAWASDSMTQGPAMRKSWPSPTWTGPISKDLFTRMIVMRVCLTPEGGGEICYKNRWVLKGNDDGSECETTGRCEV